jgi:1-acyl-sn-glycerol-3-phosphate acyltransferase
MTRIFQPVRFLTIFIMIFIYLIHMSVVWALHRDRWRRVRRANELLMWWSSAGLRILNVKVNVTGAEYLDQIRNGLFVGNHLSYLDVLVIASRVPACFVTSMEIRRAPLLGQICMMAGCLFVDRKSRANLRGEVRELSDGLAWGVNVTVFPEGTSTNGEEVLRFRRPLFMSALASGRPVMPFCLDYHRVGGEPINVVTRDKVFWYGDMSFAPHLWALAGSGGVEVDIHFLTPIEVSLVDGPAQLAERAHSAVATKFVRRGTGTAGMVPGT